MGNLFKNNSKTRASHSLRELRRNEKKKEPKVENLRAGDLYKIIHGVYVNQIGFFYGEVINTGNATKVSLLVKDKNGQTVTYYAHLCDLRLVPIGNK